MKRIGQGFIGGLIGFLGTFAIMNGNIKLPFARYSFELNVALLLIGAGLIIATVVYYVLIKQTAKKEVSGEEEDALDEWKYKKFSDFSLFAQSALIVNLLLACTSTLTEQPFWMIVTSGVFLAIITLLSLIMPTLLKAVYPERPLPATDDKDYAKKLLEMSDEGERHVMLMGLYKSFNSVNLLLFVGMLLLLFYSLATGASQLFGIIVIAAVLLFTNIQYIRSVKGK